MAIIGIDIGNTNARMAVNNNDNSKIKITKIDNLDYLPCAICFGVRHPIVGQKAIEISPIDRDHTLVRPFDIINKNMKKIIDDNAKQRYGGELPEEYSPRKYIIYLLLKKLIDSRYCGEIPLNDSCCLIYPQNWSKNIENEFISVLKEIGFEEGNITIKKSMDLVNETTKGENDIIDVGGTSTRVYVCGSHKADNQIGGILWNHILEKIMIEQIATQLGSTICIIEKNKSIMNSISKKTERCKHILSKNDFKEDVEINIDKEKNVKFEIEITKKEYEKLCEQNCNSINEMSNERKKPVILIGGGSILYNHNFKTIPIEKPEEYLVRLAAGD